jgi:endoglucanase
MWESEAMNKVFVLAAGAALWMVTPAVAATNSLPIGRCVNMGNSLEAPSEGEWGGKKIDADDFKRISEAGFNTIRLPVRWASRTDSAAPDSIDAKFMARVKQVVADARKVGLNVILNSHHFEKLHSDPSDANIAQLASMWAQIATAFATEPDDHLWFEIENEPHDKFNDSNLLSVLQPALAAIRKTNPTRPVIVGGELWSGINSLKTLTLPNDPNIIPTFHYYDPFSFTHQGADWVSPTPPMGRAYGTAEDRRQLDEDVGKVRTYITRTGKTPFIGEFGANEKIPLYDRVRYQMTVRLAFDKLGIGMCAWGYTNTFPLWDQRAKQWLPGMRAAMGLREPMLPKRKFSRDKGEK